MCDLRGKIARAIHDGPGAQAQYEEAGIAPHGFENCQYSEQYFNDADAVLAVLDLDTVRALAQVEVLEDLAVAHYLDGPQSIYDTIMRRADRIAREAGIETGEETGE